MGTEAPDRSRLDWHWGPPSLLLLLAALAISVPCIQVRSEARAGDGEEIIDANITPWGYTGDAPVEPEDGLPPGVTADEATAALRAIDRPGWMAWLVVPTALLLVLAPRRRRLGAWAGILGGALALISLGGTTQHVLDRVEEAEALTAQRLDVTLAWGFWLAGAVFAATIALSLARLVSFRRARALS